MKKAFMILAIVAVVVAVGAVVFTVLQDNDGATANVSKVPATAKLASLTRACDVFTQADADTILGGSSTKTDTSSGDVTTGSTSVTTCSYVFGEGSGLQTATVLVRASDPSSAATAFNDAKLSDAVDINDLGVKAYWEPTYGQVNILRASNWVIISVGGAKIADHSQVKATQLARLLLAKI